MGVRSLTLLSLSQEILQSVNPKTPLENSLLRQNTNLVCGSYKVKILGPSEKCFSKDGGVEGGEWGRGLRTR